jgi:hypothetical protein
MKLIEVTLLLESPDGVGEWSNVKEMVSSLQEHGQTLEGVLSVDVRGVQIEDFDDDE